MLTVREYKTHYQCITYFKVYKMELLIVRSLLDMI